MALVLILLDKPKLAEKEPLPETGKKIVNIPGIWCMNKSNGSAKGQEPISPASPAESPEENG
jgi:hypothetical protein